MTPQRKAEIDAMLQRPATTQTNGGGMTPERRAQIDAMVAGTAPTATPASEKQPGGFQRFVQGIAKPFINTATNVANFVEGTTDLAGAGIASLTGNKEASQQWQNRASEAAFKQRDFGYLGKGNAVGGDAPTANAGADFLKGAKQIVGTGAEIGSYAAPIAIGAGAKAVSAAGKAAPTIGSLAKSGAMAGSIGSAGAELATPNSTVGSVAGAGLLGGALGGVLGGAVPGIGRGLKKGGEVAAKTSGAAVSTLPERMINNVLRPAKTAFSFGKNPGRAVADLGIVANSIEEYLPEIVKAKGTIGNQIGEVIRGLGSNKTVSLSDVLSPLDTAIKTAKGFKRTNKPLIARLEALRSDLADSVGKSKQIDPQQVFEMKKAIGAMSKWTGQAFDADLNQARVGVYSKLKKALEDAANATGGAGSQNSRSLRRLNELYGNLIEAESALENRIGVAQRNNMLSLPDIGAFGTGALVAGGPGAIALLAIKKVVGSVAFRTRAAARLQAVLNKMDDPAKKVVDDILPGFVPQLEKMTPDEANKFIDALPYIARLVTQGLLSPGRQEQGSTEMQAEPLQTQ